MRNSRKSFPKGAPSTNRCDFHMPAGAPFQPALMWVTYVGLGVPGAGVPAPWKHA